MRHITIENSYGCIRVKEGALDGSRLEWRAAGQFEIWIRGAFKPLDYDAARNLALQVIIDARLPAIALKRVSRAKVTSRRNHTETKRMF